MIARLGLLALAAAALGFLGVQAREERHLQRAGAPGVGPATVESRRGALRDARRWTLTGEPRIIEAQLLLFAGRPQEALAAVLPVARREPENLRAWRTVALAAERSGDAPRLREARARTARLDPRAAG